MKRAFTIMTVVAILWGMALPWVAMAYDPGQIHGSFDYTQTVCGENGQGCVEKQCTTGDILGRLDNIIGDFKNFITDAVNSFIRNFMSNIAKSLIYCTISDIQFEGGFSFIASAKILKRVQPQCNIGIASDAAAEALNAEAQRLKRDFIGRCVGAAQMYNIWSSVDDILNSQGPNGGQVAVTSWINNLYTEPDREAMRRMWTILVNTDICPYFRTQALDYFGVPVSYRENPPSITTTELNTSSDDPFQLRGACTLPKDYVPGSESTAEDFAANGGFAMLTEIAKPQNNLQGFIDIGEAELARQRAVTVQAAVNEAVSGGGFRSVYGSGGSSCAVMDPDGHCVEPARVKNPPAAAAQMNDTKYLGPLLWVSNQNGTTSQAVIDMQAQFANSATDITNDPLPFNIEFGPETDANLTAPAPAPEPEPQPGSGEPNDPECTGGNPSCTCLKNDETTQASLVPIVQQAILKVMANDALPIFGGHNLFNPPGSPIIAPEVDRRTVLQAICDVMNQDGTKVCEPSPTVSSQIVLLFGSTTFSVDVITPDGALRTNGGIVIAACPAGIQD